jgi:citrate synthase
MIRSAEHPTTSIATSTPDEVVVRDKNLCRDLIGRVTFTEMTFFQVLGRMPRPAQTLMLDACLVALMEHGLTPSALATRMVASSAPESMQGAIAAGILGVGGTFVGTVEECAAILSRVVDSEVGLVPEARRVAREHREAHRVVPGFGHPLHRPDDPRSVRLFEIAEEHRVASHNVDAIRILGTCVDEVYGKHITINVTGAIAACLADIGVPAEIMRGFAILARCAGLVGHVYEEQRKPAMRAIWDAAERAVPYDGVLDPRSVAPQARR